MEEPNNSIYSATSLALRVIFCFIVVELIQFFHGALQLMSSHRFFTFSVYCVVIVFTAFTCVNFVQKKHFKSNQIYYVHQITKHKREAKKYKHLKNMRQTV